MALTFKKGDQSDPAAVSPDREICLAFDQQRAVVSPWGAALRRYSVLQAGAETDILWGYSGGTNKKGGQGDVLIPFPGRVARGRYSFDGEQYQLECNDKEGPNAIHGFVRAVPWTVLGKEADKATFELDTEAITSPGYPFPLSLQIIYTLNRDGLSCAFRIRNQAIRLRRSAWDFIPTSRRRGESR